jgi:hypothetical protein
MFVSLALAAAAAPMASEPPTDNRVLRYIVRKNDSLDNLARRYFVSYTAIGQVVATNRMSSARKLSENETLLIPYRVLRWTGVNGQIASFRGAVRVGAQNAAVGKVIDEGVRIETAADSFVALQFPDGSITTLPSNSRVRAVSMRRYIITGEVDRRFVVERGGSEWRVTPARGAGDRFEVRTPVATTAVRGTEFRVTYAEEGAQTGTGVVKGEVGFGTPKSDQPIPLPVGFGAVTDTSGTIDKRALLAAPDMAAGYAVQRAETVSFSAVAVAGAKAYQFEIANDSSFLDPVTTINSDSPTGKLDTLGDGQYFLRVSALDDAKLQGLSRTYVFARKLLVLAAGPDGASGRLKFSWTKGPAGTLGYRFLLSTREDMAQPLVDTVIGDMNHVGVGPLDPGKYFWRVITLSAGADDQSEPQPFELGAP